MAQKAVTIYTPIGADPHINAQDDAFIRRSLQRCESGILGDLRCTIVNDNTVRLSGGGASNRGYVLWIPDGDTLDLTITTGTQSLDRYDLVVAEFKKGGGDMPDELSFKVVVGTASVTPSDPQLVTSSMLQTGDVNQIAIFRIKLDGINIESIERVAPYASGSASFGNITSSGTLGDQADMVVCTKENGVLDALSGNEARKVLGLPSFKTYHIDKISPDSAFHYFKSNWDAGCFGAVGIFCVYINGGTYGPCESFLCMRANNKNGAAIQFGYGAAPPVYHIISDGVWSARTLSFI